MNKFQEFTRSKIIEHELIQGSTEWSYFRLTHNGASESAAMLGLSKNVTRTDLLRMKATGDSPEFGQWVQENILDHGHRVEALARPIVEGKIGRKLYPIVISRQKLSVSCDGLTMAGDVAWEHKQWNNSLAQSVENGILPEEHKPQCYQNLMITGAEYLVFTVSDGTEDNMVSMEVYPDLEWFERILAGWEQFDEDLANYQHVDEPVVLTGKAPDTLPALRVEVTGMVTASNLQEFRKTALAVFGGINKDLSTDEDFANAAKTIKWCKEVEDRLEATKEHALSQTASIDELFKTIDDIKEQAKATRLDLDKLVKKRKESVRFEILQSGKNEFSAHISSLNERLGKPYMPPIIVDFAGVMKGKKTVSSLKDAVSTELARAKIEANAVADGIQVNLTSLKELASDYDFLFNDATVLIHKNNDDLIAVVKSRIAEHKKAEEAKKEAERERIRAEELRRIDEDKKAAEEKAKAELERLERENIEAQEAAKRAEQEKKDAEAKAEADRKSAAERAEKEKQEAIERERKAAEEREKDRIAAEEETKRREDEERERREKNKKHNAAINNQAMQCFIDGGLDKDQAKIAVQLIAQKKVDHVTIAY